MEKDLKVKVLEYKIEEIGKLYPPFFKKFKIKL